ncbi:hypothetical protein XENTR_v10018521 [Xenopus tropicalis]|nr:hypothetical protein XENTR_v10018521 [Xenopus tropicalis]
MFLERRPCNKKKHLPFHQSATGPALPFLASVRDDVIAHTLALRNRDSRVCLTAVSRILRSVYLENKCFPEKTVNMSNRYFWRPRFVALHLPTWIGAQLCGSSTN